MEWFSFEINDIYKADKPFKMDLNLDPELRLIDLTEQILSYFKRSEDFYTVDYFVQTTNESQITRIKLRPDLYMGEDVNITHTCLIVGNVVYDHVKHEIRQREMWKKREIDDWSNPNNRYYNSYRYHYGSDEDYYPVKKDDKKQYNLDDTEEDEKDNKKQYDLDTDEEKKYPHLASYKLNNCISSDEELYEKLNNDLIKNNKLNNSMKSSFDSLDELEVPVKKDNMDFTNDVEMDEFF